MEKTIIGARFLIRKLIRTLPKASSVLMGQRMSLASFMRMAPEEDLLELLGYCVQNHVDGKTADGVPFGPYVVGRRVVLDSGDELFLIFAATITPDTITIDEDGRPSQHPIEQGEALAVFSIKQFVGTFDELGRVASMYDAHPYNQGTVPSNPIRVEV